MTNTNSNQLSAATVTDKQIRALADGCFARNDGALRMICTIALEGLDGVIVDDREYTVAEARQACADAINAQSTEPTGARVKTPAGWEP